MSLPTLHPTGVAILLVYGAHLHPPRNGKPGMRATVYANGDVHVQPVGYVDWIEERRAMYAALNTCLAAGLQVALRDSRGFITRRKPCSASSPS